MTRIYDLSPPLDDNLTLWPGDEVVKRTVRASIDAGQLSNLSSLSFSAHAGSHVDAPLHFCSDGVSIYEVPLDTWVGRCRVVEHHEARHINRDDIDSFDLQGVERVLFKTPNREWRNQGEFHKEFVGLLPDAAQRIVELGLRLVGTDYLSIEAGFEQKLGVHKILCGAGVAILETLNLREVPVGEYELIALPLAIPGGDGSPVRAILRELDE